MSLVFPLNGRAIYHQQRMPEQDTIDAEVVVAAADLDALVCAAHLARAGVQVVVVAAHPIIGGLVGTREAMGGAVGIRCPDLPLSVTTRLVEELELTDYGLDLLANAPSLVTIPWDDGRPFIMFSEVDPTLDMLGVLDPSSLDSYRRYLDDALPLAELVLDLADANGHPQRTIASIGPLRMRRLWSELKAWEAASAMELLSKYFESDVITATALVLARPTEIVDPTAPGSGRLALSLALRHGTGSCRVMGGHDALIGALIRSIEDHGGSFVTGVDGARVRTFDAQFTALELADGDVLDGQALVASGDPRVLVNEWLDDRDALGTHTLRRYKESTPDHACYSHIDAVISAQPDYIALAQTPFINADHVATSTVAVVPTVAELLDARAVCASGKVPNRPAMLAATTSLADPSLAPAPGQHLFSLDVLDTPMDLDGGWVDSDEPRRWLESFADVIAPGFSHTVEEWSLLTPPEVEREAGLVDGGLLGHNGSAIEALLGRRRELTRYRFPIGGLYLTGPSTFPGSALPGAAGRSTAAVVLRDLGR